MSRPCKQDTKHPRVGIKLLKIHNISLNWAKCIAFASIHGLPNPSSIVDGHEKIACYTSMNCGIAHGIGAVEMVELHD